MSYQIFNEPIFVGFFLGVMLLMIAYNFSLYTGFKDKSYIYLIIFILTCGLALLIINGFTFQYIRPNLFWLNNKSLPLFIFASLASSIEFYRLLLKVKSFNPLFEKILIIERNLFILGMLFSSFLGNAVIIKLSAILTVVTIITLVAAGLLSYKSGNRKSLLVIAPWSLFFLGIILFILKSYNLLPANLLTESGMEIGFLALMILSPISIPDRIKHEKKEKYSAQEKLVEALKQSEKVLRESVQEQTEEINKINIMLMDRAIELGSINQLSEKVYSSLNLNEVMQSACEELIKIFPVESASIALFNDDRTKLTIAAIHSGTADKEVSIGTEIDLKNNESLLSVIESRKPVVVENISNNPHNENLQAFKQLQGINNVLIVPVMSLMKVIGVIILPPIELDYKFNKSEIDLAKTIAIQVASSVENARLFSQKEKALNVAENDLEIGRQIQSGFFPDVLREIEGWEFYASFKAARQVAGDFYDLFKIGDTNYTAFVIGDVCDKGVGAALFMVLFRSLLRAYSSKEKASDDVRFALKNIILNTNNYIAETHSKANMFASIFFGILDPEKNEIHYINGGLEAPIIIDCRGKIINKLLPTGPVIGMFSNMNYTVNSIILNPGDILFAYTDGTTDAKNSRQELFSEEKLLELIAETWDSGFSMLYNLNSNLDKHIGSQDQYDDITQITLRRKLSPDENRHSIIRKAEYDNLEELREFVENAVLYCGLNNDLVFAFKLAAEEMCTNIIKYGYEGQEAGIIKIEFILGKDKAVLKIYDYGKQFIPEEYELPDINADWENREIGGLGIKLVNGLMDKIEYTKGSDNSNCIILEKRLI